jgi:thiol:disulfide interchange protein DsbC
MFKKFLFALALTGCAASAVAADAPDKTVRDAVQSLAPGIKVDSIQDAPFPGFYQVMASGRLIYVSADGKYMLNGNVIDIGAKKDLSAETWAKVRKAEIAKIDANHKLVFAPADPKYTVTVFTDVDCGYCRELHKHIDEFNKAGIAVQYVFWPREGVKTTAGNDTPSYTRAVAVWCASDRKKTFTSAIQGGDVGAAKCSNPVSDDFSLGERIGVNGTPTIVTASGDVVGGYVTPAQLLAVLKKLEQGGSVDDLGG